MSEKDLDDQDDLPPAGHGMVRIPKSATEDFAEECRKGRKEAQEIADLEDLHELEVDPPGAV